MARLLYIEASPRKDRSASIQIARDFLEAYRDAHPDDEVDKLDLWSHELPEFDGATINAKYAVMHGQDHTVDQKAAWDRVVAEAERFSSADRYLISVPMWNFGVPYKLKHYIDFITQPGLVFSFSPDEGYKGLVTGKPAVVIYARGGAYGGNSEGGKMDFQKPYVELWLGFIGFTDIHPIVIEPTLARGSEGKDKAMNTAREQVGKIVSEL